MFNGGEVRWMFIAVTQERICRESESEDFINPGEETVKMDSFTYRRVEMNIRCLYEAVTLLIWLTLKDSRTLGLG